MMFLIMLQSRLVLVFQRVLAMARRRWFLAVATVACAAFLAAWALAVPDLLQTLTGSPVRMRGAALDLPESVAWMQCAGTLSFVTGALRMLAGKRLVWLLAVALTSLVPVALIVYFVREWIREFRPADGAGGEPPFPARNGSGRLRP